MGGGEGVGEGVGVGVGVGVRGSDPHAKAQRKVSEIVEGAGLSGLVRGRVIALGLGLGLGLGVVLGLDCRGARSEWRVYGGRGFGLGWVRGGMGGKDQSDRSRRCGLRLGGGIGEGARGRVRVRS